MHPLFSNRILPRKKAYVIIQDRLVHNFHRIEMRGDSMRKIRGNLEK
jgi:hypothetical protein